MFKYLLLLLIPALLFSLTFTNIGTRGFTTSSIYNFDMAYDISNVPWIIYYDTNTALRTTLRKYISSNGNWDIISSNFTPNISANLNLFIDTNQYSYSFSNFYTNYFGNYTYNLETLITNDITNITTNRTLTNGVTYTNITTFSTNRSNKLYTTFRDLGKLYRPSLMKYNNGVWTTNTRGFSTNIVSEIKSKFLIVVSPLTNLITNAYLPIQIGFYTNIITSLTDVYFNFVFTNVLTNTNVITSYWVSNFNSVNGVDFGWSSMTNIDDTFTNIIMPITNLLFSTNADGTTNVNTNYIQNMTNNISNYYVSPPGTWASENYHLFNGTAHSNAYVGAGETPFETNWIISYVFTNSLFSTNILTNLLTNVFTNMYTNYSSNSTFTDSETIYSLVNEKPRTHKTSMLKLTNLSANFLYAGNYGFSSSTATFLSMAFDVNNYIYAAYQDTGYNFNIRVMKYTNAGLWHSVTSVNFTNRVNYPIIKNDGTNSYVAFEDLRTLKTSVYKYTNAGNWFALGNINFSTGRANYINMELVTNGVLVSYVDRSINNMITIMKHTNAGNWFVVSTNVIGPSGGAMKMLLNTNYNPIIIFTDYTSNNRLSVMEGN